MSFTKFTNLFFLFSPLLIICLSIVVVSTAFVPLLGIVLSIGLCIGFWAFRDPLKPLLLAIFLIPFDKLTVIFPPKIAGVPTSYLNTLTIPKLILLIVFFAWAMRILVLKERSILKKLSGQNLSLPIVIFFILCSASVLNIQGEGIKLFVLYEMRLLSLIVLFFLLVNLIDRMENLIKLIKYLVVSYFFVGLIGLYEIISKEHILDLMGYPMPEMPYAMSERVFRVAGTSGDPDYWSFSTVFAFALTLFFLGPRSSKKTKVILFPVLALHFLNIIGSGSRGALLAFLGTACTFWLFVKLRHKGLLGISFLVCAGFLLFLYTFYVSELPLGRYSGQVGTTSITFRIGWARMAWGMIKDNPLFGVGFGNFPVEYHRYVYLAPEVPKDAYWPHNSFLQIWAECGPFALLTYLSLYTFAIVNLYKAIKTSRDSMVQLAAISSLSLLVGMIFFGVTALTILFELYWLNFAFAAIVSNLSKTTTAQRGYPNDLDFARRGIPMEDGIENH